jgi:ribulose-5-phosphate 4-epimerase/fuculose-1-phosphate aldolase
MTFDLKATIEDLVVANRILSRENVVDAYGHVSVRHPDNPQRFLLSRARAPEAIVAGDIMEFGFDGEPVDARGRRPYLERFIHAAIYVARPDVQSVVHSHSRDVIPFGVTGAVLRPVMHTCASIGYDIPVWDTQPNFGDTDMLVSNMAMGHDLARRLGPNATALMRGHGSVAVGASLREAVNTAVSLNLNAEFQIKAAALGRITFLSKGEVDKVNGGNRPYVGVERAWEYWCIRAGLPYRKLG